MAGFRASDKPAGNLLKCCGGSTEALWHPTFQASLLRRSLRHIPEA
jgi:hypothetical protein